MLLKDIKTNGRHRKDLGDLTPLVDSIREVGMIHPPTVTKDGGLVAGRRRVEAAKLLGMDSIHVHVWTGDKLLRAELDENSLRKDFNPEEFFDLATDLLEYETAQAKERQAEAGPATGKGKKSGCGKLPQAVKGKTRDKVAHAVGGMSGRTFEKLKAVMKSIRQEPKKYQGLLDEMNRTGRVGGIAKKLRNLKAAEDIAKEPPPLPKGPFRVIVADPPWRYDNRPEDPSHRGSLPYPSMSIEEITKLPVGAMAHADSVLWLWTTNSHIEHSFAIAKAWGFEYKTLLTWVKNRMGTGDWLRGKTEHCLLAVKGKPTIVLTNQTTCLQADAGEHSKKPDEFYAMVEKLCPGSKVELFSRNQREGWTVFGNEVQANAD
jgi:N6-adenosine-specific RNA methylase IME4